MATPISKKDLDSSKALNNKVKEDRVLQSRIKVARKDAQSLSYEETIKRIDVLLHEMQNEEVALEELYDHYLKGKVYLEHCEELLKTVENSLVELDPSSLT